MMDEEISDFIIAENVLILCRHVIISSSYIPSTSAINRLYATVLQVLSKLCIICGMKSKED